MNRRIGFLNQNGVSIFKIDLSNLEGTELLEHVMYTTLITESIKEETNFLIDVRNCKLDMDSLVYIKIAGKNAQKYVKKSAVLGVSRNLRSFLNIYIKFTKSKIKVFETEGLAEEYFSQV